MCRFTWSAPQNLNGEFIAKLVTTKDLPNNIVMKEVKFTLPGKSKGSTTMPSCSPAK